MTLPSDFLAKYGPWAVVTGSSSGLGFEFASQLAAAGLSIVLVARRVERLEELAAKLSENYPVQTKVIPADLSKEEGWRTVIADTADIDVGTLINNAGVELHGSFFRDSVEAHTNLVNVNVTAVTALAHAFGRRFADRGKGGILFVSSMLSCPNSWFASYSASKSYVTSLSLILREELNQKGVSVTTLEPGVISTEMGGEISGDIDLQKLGFFPMEAKDCVKDALASFYDNKARITPGLLNTIMFWVTRAMPLPLVLKLTNFGIAKVMKPELVTYE